jgi:hypothetical protein
VSVQSLPRADVLVYLLVKGMPPSEEWRAAAKQLGIDL